MRLLYQILARTFLRCLTITLFMCAFAFNETRAQLMSPMPPTGYGMGSVPALSERWLLWWQQQDGTPGFWVMRWTNHVGGGPLSTNGGVSSVWHLAGVGDFGGYGGKDLLWEHTNGFLAVWFMQGTNHLASAWLNPNQVNPVWQVAAIGDFGGPAGNDILWRHAQGWVSIWLMRGTDRVAVVAIQSTAVDPSWQVAGTGDFNGDGQTDILWRHRDGWLAVWFMHGPQRIGEEFLSPNLVNPVWAIVGTEDLNDDGQADIVWRNQTNGLMAFWLMSGTGRITSIGWDLGPEADSWSRMGSR